MLTAVGAAVIAAVASLVGVTLGALLEPLKLNAARRAKLRQDRADRCAGLIEAATRARQHVIDLNVLYRRMTLTADSPESDQQRQIEYESAYYVARAEVRGFLGLLIMSGPDELIERARQVRELDTQLHDVRFELDPTGEFNRVYLPPVVREAAKRLDRAIEEFALVARKHTS